MKDWRSGRCDTFRAALAMLVWRNAPSICIRLRRYASPVSRSRASLTVRLRSMARTSSDVSYFHRSLSEALLRPRPIRGAAAALRHVGADEAWRHGVHGDAVLAQFQGKAPRENDHLGLRCRVECIARQRGADRAIRDCLSGSKPKMHSFDAVWWSSRSRFKHCAMMLEH
jgi:hypothetical protein